METLDDEGVNDVFWDYKAIAEKLNEFLVSVSTAEDTGEISTLLSNSS